MNAITLIAVLFLTVLCFGTLLPPTEKNRREKGKHSDKVSVKENIFYSHL